MNGWDGVAGYVPGAGYLFYFVVRPIRSKRKVGCPAVSRTFRGIGNILPKADIANKKDGPKRVDGGMDA